VSEKDLLDFESGGVANGEETTWLASWILDHLGTDPTRV
jgi:hypothetical protein